MPLGQRDPHIQDPISGEQVGQSQIFARRRIHTSDETKQQ